MRHDRGDAGGREHSEYLLNEEGSGRELREPLGVGERDVVVAAALDQAHHGGGVFAIDGQQGEMEHSTAAEAPRERGEIVAVDVGEPRAVQFVARFRNREEPLNRAFQPIDACRQVHAVDGRVSGGRDA